MDICNLNLDELQNKIMKEKRNNFLGDLTNPIFIKEKMIVIETRKNLEVISKTNLAFARDSKSKR